MKNYTLPLFIFLLACTASLSAQEDKDNFKRFNFGFDIGANIPERGFAKNDTTALPYTVTSSQTDTSTFNGFAKNGFHFNVYARYMLTQNIGVMISVGGNFNSYDVATLNTNEDAQYTRYGFSGNLPVITASGSYYVGEYLFGFYYKLPLGPENLSFEVKAMLGMITANYPTLTYSYNYMGVTETQSESVTSGTGLGYNFGGGLKYSVAKGLIGLHLGVGYTGCSVTYPSYTISSSSTPSATYSVPKSMTIGIIQFSVGASIEI